jgi:hypothetical protein
MNRLFTFLIFFVSVISISAQQVYPPVSVPDRIMLTIPGDPATTAAVTWRTLFSDSISFAQIAEANASPAPEKNSKTINGKSRAWETGSNSSMGHSVIFKDLKPSSGYVYRVGNGKVWSEWLSFRTASDKAEPFSFLYLGDIQTDITSQCSRVIRQAYSHFPESKFILMAGDIVNRSQDDLWHQLFTAGGWIFGMTPSMPTPGNHEYNTDPNDKNRRVFSSHWQQIFTMPANGPSRTFDSRVYYVDYQGVRFISLDSPAIGYSESDRDLILKWLEQTLTANPNRWTVLFTHYPIYSCSQGRDSEEYRDMVKPILEKYGVDLVLQGHDHTYCRGQNVGQAGKEFKNLPVYVVSVSGPKMYGLNSSLWADRVASETQLYQNISFSGNKLTYRSFTAAGELYDGFSIVKNQKEANKYSELPEIKNIKERITIPEARRNSYKPEEIVKIENRMKNDD